jgi:hypothetical protein
MDASRGEPGDFPKMSLVLMRAAAAAVLCVAGGAALGAGLGGLYRALMFAVGG